MDSSSARKSSSARRPKLFISLHALYVYVCTGLRMAASPDIIKKIKDITECPICFEVLTKPKVLPCIHTFCHECLASNGKDVKPGDKLTCPVCKDEFTLPANGFDGLRGNFFVEKLVEVAAISKVPAEEVSCDLCADEEKLSEKIHATVYCIECRQNMCEDCAKPHRKMRVSKSHQLVQLGIQEVAEFVKASPSYCDQHKDERVTLFCSECNCAICAICHAEDHYSHKCLGVAKASDKFLEQLEKDIKKVVEHSEKCSEELKVLEKIKLDFVGKVSKTKEAIEQKAEEIKRLVDSHASNLVDSLLSEKTQKMKDIESMQQHIEMNRNMMDSFKTFTVNVLENGTPSDISRMGKDLLSRANHLHTIKVENHLRPIEVTITSTNIEDAGLQPKKNIVGDILVTNLCDRLEIYAAAPVQLNTIASTGYVIYGVCVLGENLYICRGGSPCISEHSVASGALLREMTFNIPAFNNGYQTDMASCAVNSCLYVADNPNAQVHKIQMPAGSVTTWSVIQNPEWLSVASDGCVVVTYKAANKLREFNTNGQQMKEVALVQPVRHPRRAVKLQCGSYVVCHGEGKNDPNHGVSVVGANGSEIYQFGAKPGAGATQMNSPWYIEIDKFENILVADYNNRRVVLLNNTLETFREILPASRGFRCPSRVCLDSKSGRLFVASASDHQIYVFQVHDMP